MRNELFCYVSDLRDGERRVLRVVDRLPARDPARHARGEPPRTSAVLSLLLLWERGHRRVGLRLECKYTRVVLQGASKVVHMLGNG